MKKAILMFAHKDPEYLDLFIDQLLFETSEQTDIFIHMDKNHDELVNKITKRSHVRFIKNNIPIQWGNDSMIRALISCFNEIVDLEIPYDYFFITTGQDILVKQGLDKFLEANNGKIFLDCWHDSSQRVKWLKHRFPAFMCSSLVGKTNLKRIIRGIYLRLISLGLAPQKHLDLNFKSIDFWRSYNWSAMPYEVLKYITSYINNNPQFVNAYMNSFIPEDIFLGTIIMNSKYKHLVVFEENQKSFTLTFWKEFSYGHMINLSVDDIKEIDSSNCFFARKADLQNQLEFVDYYYHKITGKCVK